MGRGSYKPKNAPGSIGNISAWLSVAGATSDVNGISSVPDLLNSNPAVQATNALKPTRTFVNGRPCMQFASGQFLGLPLIANNNAANQWGVALWVNFDVTVGLFSCPLGVRSLLGASVTRLFPQLSGNTQNIRCVFTTTDGTVGPALTGQSLLGAWRFLTFEFDVNDAVRGRLTIDAATIATANGTGTGALVVPTGELRLGCSNTNSEAFIGLLGPNIFFASSKAPGATAGLWTPEQRLLLMQYQKPTG